MISCCSELFGATASVRRRFVCVDLRVCARREQVGVAHVEAAK